MKISDLKKDGGSYAEQYWRLYESAFPSEEKKPVPFMEELYRKGITEFLVLEEKHEFAGLVILMKYEGVVLLDYFAVTESIRGKGIGSEVLSALLELYRDWKFVVEIEALVPEAGNLQERIRRKSFYMKNGLKETGVFAYVYETDFEILSSDGQLTYEQYVQFLTDTMGSFLLEAGKIHRIAAL
ncbi:MAG: GNAT family N-acetyltransferase [Blautia sp.]|nr:GNAT family N-acetyltransferase [Blautia sp.]